MSWAKRYRWTLRYVAVVGFLEMVLVLTRW